MNEIEQIRALAQAAGATHARAVEQDRLQVYDWVVASCAANACGRYGRCWTCPPQLGTLDELADRLQPFPGGVLVQNITAVEDSWDFEGMAEAAKTHNQMMRDLAAQIAERFPAYTLLALGCGGCGYCERCTCPDEPCRFPEQALPSVEGFGLDAKRLVESCGLSYINGVNTVSYVGLLLLRHTEEYG